MPEALLPAFLQRGATIEFEYPSHNLFGVPIEYVRRVVEVELILDFFDEPLPLSAILERPRVRRGTTFLIGRDVEINQTRKFYLEATRGAQLPSWQFGLFDPTSPTDSIEFVGRKYRPDLRDWKRFVAKSDVLREKDFGRLQIGAFRVKA